MRMLVIGAKGMLGQEFMRQLQDGVASESSRRRTAFSVRGGSALGMTATIPNGNEVIGWGRADLDITNEAEVMQKVGALKPSVIFNCAAYNNVDKAEDEPEVANAINGEAVGYLARAAVDCGAVFVHFSTDYVFSGNLPLTKSYAAAYDFVRSGYIEEDVPDPLSAYGQSKALGEERVLSIFCHPDPEPREGEGSRDSSVVRRGGLPQNDKEGARWYIIRTSRLFGPAGTGETSKKSFPEMMIGFARAKGRIEAIDAEVGSPTYVKDLVGAVINLFPPIRLRGGEEGLRTLPPEAGRHNAPQPPLNLRGEESGIYHITNSGSCTWYEYAKAAVEFAGVRAEVVPVGPEKFPRKAKRPANSTLLNTKLPPLRPWQEALKEFLKEN